MTPLPHNSHIGTMSVHPKTWLKPDHDTSKDWYIHYRYYNPSYKEKYPKGYRVVVKGMNASKGVTERREVTKRLLQNEMDNLTEGYNPITGMVDPPIHAAFHILPSTTFVTALYKAYELLPSSPTKNEMRKSLKHINRAIQELQFHRMEIHQIRRSHIKAILEKVARNKKHDHPEKKEWGAASYNHYRSYLQMLFNQLEEVQATEVDPVSRIKKKKQIKKLPQELTDDQVKQINTIIREKHYAFWRFIHIFFHSGAREAEMMKVQRGDVQLAKHRFKVTILKGQQFHEEWKTIEPAARALWQEVMEEKAPGKDDLSQSDYLFSRGLTPGIVPINEHQVRKRWRVHIKKKLGITADFYFLKKKHTTELVSKAMEKIERASQEAAARNSHTNTAMVRKIYDIQGDERLHNELKKVQGGLE